MNPMIPLSITPNIEAAPWSEQKATLAQNGLGDITRIGRLPRGTVSGKSTVSVVVRMADGREFVAQTTMELFLAAARALKAVEEEMSGANTRN